MLTAPGRWPAAVSPRVSMMTTGSAPIRLDSCSTDQNAINGHGKLQIKKGEIAAHAGRHHRKWLCHRDLKTRFDIN
jgi:hypothetical protein